MSQSLIEAIDQLNQTFKDNTTVIDPSVHNDLQGRSDVDCHPIGAVTSLQTSLDGKSDTSHTHTNDHTHSNLANLDEIDQDLSTGDAPTFNALTIDAGVALALSHLGLTHQDYLQQLLFLADGRVSIDTNDNGLLVDNAQNIALDYSTANNDQVLGIASGALAWVAQSGGASSIDAVVALDVKTVGTGGGTATSGAWRTRDLNTSRGNTAMISISSNTITLNSGYGGEYFLIATAPAFRTNRHQIRLNINSGGAFIYGQSSHSNPTSGSGSPTHSVLFHARTLSEGDTIILQHICNTTFSGTGWGLEGNFNQEVYSQVALIRVV